jgi:hypothetical protein
LAQGLRKQVCIKTNAWVDKKIPPIIEALAFIDGLESFESCESWFPDVGFAHILFYYGYGEMRNDWKALAFLCSKLAEAFRKSSVGYIWTGLHWWSDNDIPYGYIIVKPDDINNIASAIRELAATVGLRELMTFYT